MGINDNFSFAAGTTPLLISIPHDGRALPPDQLQRMTEAGKAIPDTDWFVRELYAFAHEMGASVLAANYSRYVVDLNRSASNNALYAGQVSTGLCPLQTFAGDNIYVAGETVSPAEQEVRVQKYWRPYHDRIQATLAALKKEFGYALLWDAHSIAAEVPRLFDGVLTDLNIGTNDDKSCAPACTAAVMRVASASPYSCVANGRFRGGFITRHYGNPEQDIHALQLELSQSCYIGENELRYDAELAAQASATIKKLLMAFMTAALESR